MITPGQSSPAPATLERVQAPVARRIIRRQPSSRYRAGRPLDTPDSAIAQRIHLAIAETGLQLAQVAKIVGVAVRRIHLWRRNDPTFHDLVREGYDIYNSRHVEASLLKRALGYDVEETTEVDVEVFGKTPLGISVKVPAHKTVTRKCHIPPDVGAIVFYLTNRDRQRWANTQRTEREESHTFRRDFNFTFDVKKITTEELHVVRDILRKAGVEVPALGSPS